MQPSPYARHVPPLALIRRRSVQGPARRVRRRFLNRPGPAGQFRFPVAYADQPVRKFAKLRYVVHENFSGPGAVAIVSIQYRANGMYDPEVVVGGGHQPYGFDQLMNQYFNFTVLRSVIDVESVGQVAYKNLVTFIAYHNEAGVPAAAFASGGANGLREMAMISKDIMPVTIAAFKQGPRSTRLFADIAKVNGKTTQQILADPNYAGSVSADPVEDCYFSVNTYAPDASDQSAATVNLKVTITYYAVFHEPRWQVLS